MITTKLLRTFISLRDELNDTGADEGPK
jgi:hypothetical protein